MIVENSKKKSKFHGLNRILPWLNLVLAVLLIVLGIWYLSDKVSIEEIVQALILADTGFILLGVALMLINMLLKSWRWQLMFMTPDEAVPFSPLFWSLSLEKYVNLILPFLRLGEIARIYALNRQIDMPIARSLGTLVLEKVLDFFVLVLAIALILPLVILPVFVSTPGLFVWILPVVALLVLYLFAYQTEIITRFFSALAEKIPTRLAKRLLTWSISGLEGLSSLRSRRQSLLLVCSSVLILILSILVPYVILAAFGIRLGFVEAAVIHIVVTIATTPPSTPGKIGVFNGAVALTLLSFGITDEPIIIGYSIMFYLVVVVPQIVLGIIAAARTDWHWHQSKEQMVVQE